MHQNLFAYFETTPEAYRKLCADHKKDSRTISWLQLAFGLSLLAAVNDFQGWGKALWVVTVYLGIVAVQYFVDQSNRNFLLHWIDYERATYVEREKIRLGLIDPVELNS